MKQMGSEMGSGNPPGEYSSSYLDSSEGEVRQFMTDKSYETGMDVGVNRSATEIGNQPKQSDTFTLESRADKENSI